jgi:hypothetical protein
MKNITAIIAIILLAAPIALAKDAPSYEKGELLSMESVSCGYSQSSGKSVAGDILGTDSGHLKTQEVLCQEYTIQTDRLVYRIRPKDTKHPVLLPVGETVKFRIHKDEMYLRVSEGDDKERQYNVLSIQMREDASGTKTSQ